jgi:hypothetical protein
MVTSVPERLINALYMQDTQQLRPWTRIDPSIRRNLVMLYDSTILAVSGNRISDQYCMETTYGKMLVPLASKEKWFNTEIGGAGLLLLIGTFAISDTAHLPLVGLFKYGKDTDIFARYMYMSESARKSGFTIELPLR